MPPNMGEPSQLLTGKIQELENKMLQMAKDMSAAEKDRQRPAGGETNSGSATNPSSRQEEDPKAKMRDGKGKKHKKGKGSGGNQVSLTKDEIEFIKELKTRIN